MQTWRYHDFCQMPTEVLCFILDHVGKANLKNARLACKSLSPIIDSILFQEVIVVPQYGSLDALIQLAQHHTLNKHIRQVTLDYRWGIIMRSSKTADIARIRDEFVSDAVVGDSDVEVAYLSRAFRMLPALTRLLFRATGTLRARCHVPTEMPSYYIRYLERLGPEGRNDISGTNGLRKATPPTMAWLAAFSAGICLRDVQADGLLTSYMFAESRRFESVRIAFRSLQHLQLSFSLREHGNSGSDTEGLFYLLGELPALKSLDLSGLGVPRDHFDPPHFTEYLSLGTVLSWASQYPRLARLSLQGFSALEAEITFFMETNATSLESLRLANIILIGVSGMDNDTSRPRTTPCWVRIVHGLQANLKLKHMEFGEYLSNLYNQNWCIHDEFDNSQIYLKARVENYVVNGGDCPLDHCAVSEEDSITGESRGLPDGGDESWYEHDPSCADDESEEGDGHVDDNEDDVW